MQDKILDAYMLVCEGKDKGPKDFPKAKFINAKGQSEDMPNGCGSEKSFKKKKKKINEKSSMTAGDGKTGDLEGPTKGTIKKSGPAEADGFKKADEAPAGLSPVKKKNVKESTNMTFEDLYKKVLEEQDIESPDYNDEMGEFPSDSDQEIGADMGDEADVDMDEGSIYSQLADLFSKLAEMKGAGAGAEMDMEDEMGQEPGLGEAVSEPEPKELKGSVTNLQAPCKLGRDGYKVVKKKASASAGTGERDGELKPAPKGPTPGKSPMTVGGSSPAASGKNASFLES